MKNEELILLAVVLVLLLRKPAQASAPPVTQPAAQEKSTADKVIDAAFKYGSTIVNELGEALKNDDPEIEFVNT